MTLIRTFASSLDVWCGKKPKLSSLLQCFELQRNAAPTKTITTSAYATANALDELYGLGFAYMDTEDAKYEAVTLAQVKAAAHKSLKPDALVISIVKPQ